MHPARTYVLFMFFFGLIHGLPTTTYVPGLLRIGLTLSDVILVNIWFWGTIVLMELPTGMLADGKSRVWSVRASGVFMAAGAFLYALANSFAAAVVGEVLVGIGMAFHSGANQAWVTDALIKRGERLRLGAVFGTGALSRAMGMLIGGVIGADLGMLDLRLGWVGSGVAALCCLCIAATAMNGDGEPDTRLTEMRAFHASWSALRGSTALSWAVAASATLGLVIPFNHFWTPFFRERTGQFGLGGIWIVCYGACAAGGWFMRRRAAVAATETRGIVASLLAAGVSLAIIGGLPGVALPLAVVAIHEIGRGFFDPLLALFTQRRVESGYRATFGSLQSLLSNVGFAAVLGGVWLGTLGKPSNGATIASVWLVAGSLLAVASILLWVFRPKT